jgi:propanol-preferring alcohol dehydrogenase
VANATYQDAVDFLKLAEKITIQSSLMKYAFEDANQALFDLKHSQFNGEAVLVMPR